MKSAFNCLLQASAASTKRAPLFSRGLAVLTDRQAALKSRSSQISHQPSGEPPIKPASLLLQNGIEFRGSSFGSLKSQSGEVVFTTSLVGYPESMTDPSYRGQILVFTQPLIGNYGVPAATKDRFGLFKHFESEKIQVSGIVVSNYSVKYSHWNAVQSLASWCHGQQIPAIMNVDTRALTQMLRDQGSTLGQIAVDGNQVPFTDPNHRNLVAEVSTSTVKVYNRGGDVKIALIDCGVKQNIIRCLAQRGAEVHLVPHDYDVSKHSEYDGIFISNGPGNPAYCTETVRNIRKLYKQHRPIFGICMGNLLMGEAAGISSYKLQFGNRSHNQPAVNQETGLGVITSQNHGFALDDEVLPAGWKKYFVNINDGSNEGIMHMSKPFRSVQFHPEAKGGPQDTYSLFDTFLADVRTYQKQKRNIASRRMDASEAQPVAEPAVQYLYQ